MTASKPRPAAVAEVAAPMVTARTLGSETLVESRCELPGHRNASP